MEYAAALAKELFKKLPKVAQRNGGLPACLESTICEKTHRIVVRSVRGHNRCDHSITIPVAWSFILGYVGFCFVPQTSCITARVSMKSTQFMMLPDESIDTRTRFSRSFLVVHVINLKGNTWTHATLCLESERVGTEIFVAVNSFNVLWLHWITVNENCYTSPSFEVSR